MRELFDSELKVYVKAIELRSGKAVELRSGKTVELRSGKQSSYAREKQSSYARERHARLRSNEASDNTVVPPLEAAQLRRTLGERI